MLTGCTQSTQLCACMNAFMNMHASYTNTRARALTHSNGTYAHIGYTGRKTITTHIGYPGLENIK